MTVFQKIKGGKYDFIEEQEIRNKIDEAGRKNIIFVEGRDDERIFSILFAEETVDKIAFIGAGGHHMVTKYVDGAINNNIYHMFGIIDRDFLSDLERIQTMERRNNKLFVHKRYTIENYLIEPAILLELVKDKQPHTSLTEKQIESIILEIYEELCIVMAGNKLLLQNNISKLNTNTKPESKIVLYSLERKFKESDVSYNSNQIEEKMEDFLQQFTNLSTLNEFHENINGKYAFYQFKIKIRESNIKGINDDLMTKCHLARILKDHGIQAELCEMVERFCA